ncbi:MAG: hypothetical protein Q8P74_01945 [bacterium]|nr:hypothetical protein [bacterium]
MQVKNFPEEKRVFFSRLNKLTLIETLTIFAVIGLLFALILVVMGPARERARDAEGESDVRKAMAAFEIKYHDEGRYPDLPDALTDISKDNMSLSPGLEITPRTNDSRVYQWYDGGDDQKFCLLFQYEAKSGYFTCSYRGCQTNAAADCPNF